MSPTKRKKTSCQSGSSTSSSNKSTGNNKKQRCLEPQDEENISKESNQNNAAPVVGRPVSDNEALLTIFPAELWTMITDNVRKYSSDKDIDNMSNASLYFRNFFLDDRINFMFADVLKILKGSSRSQERDLLGSDVLKCRQVCSTWNKAVEKLYQRNPAHFEMDSTEGSTSSAVISRDKYTAKFSRSATISKFIDHYKQTHISTLEGTSKNPFLGRSVSFQLRRQSTASGRNEPAVVTGAVQAVAGPSNAARVRGAVNANFLENAIVDLRGTFRELSESLRELSDILEDAFQLFETEVTTLLKKYGRHIWYCTIELPIRSERQTPADVYSTLRCWMRLMPNIKVLTVSFNGSKTLLQRYPVQLSRKIARFQLPKLNHLQFLKTDNICSPIFNELIRANYHIRKLQMKNVRGDYCIFAASNRLSNLKGLSLSVSAAQHLLTFENVPTSGDWNLDELHLLLAEDAAEESSVFVNWSKMLQLVQTKWGNGLKRLQLHLPEPSDSTEQNKVLEESSSFKWNLPHVTHLNLKLSSVACIDFLLPLKESLESLHIICKVGGGSGKGYTKRTMQHKRIQAGQTIQFLGYTGRMNKSNIWTIFPNLKEIHVTRTSDQFDRTFLKNRD